MNSLLEVRVEQAGAKIGLGKAKAKTPRHSVGIARDGRAYSDGDGECIGIVKKGFVYPVSSGRVISWHDLIPTHIVRTGKIYELLGTEQIDY